MPENLLGRDVMHDKDEAAAMVRIRPAVEPFRREHRVLRGLHDRRPARPIREFDKAFDAQQIFPTQLDLWCVYIPGSTNERPISVITHDMKGQRSYRGR